MSHLLSTYAILALIIFVYITVGFIISVFIKRNDIADIMWGGGFLIVAITSFIMNDLGVGVGLVASILTVIWSLRLSIHIFRRNIKKSEDPRYRKWRQQWGRWFYLRSYFQVFLLQGILLLLIASPVVFANVYGNGLHWLHLIGGSVWLVGFLFETIGDYQLSQFLKKQENKGQVMQSGLWQYTRHPNYFGEVTQWWGLFIIALSVPFGWISVIGPLTITTLILYVSGVPMAEQQMATLNGFDEYKKRVSKFVPLP